jgi:transposase-like protein
VDTNRRRIEYTERDRSRQMEKKKHRVYTEEFKLEALGLLKSSGKSALQIERDLGITAGMLTKWRDRYQAAGSEDGNNGWLVV